MSRIREKATESEAVVRNITKDIQVLDLAKKNLILSMTTLKRLQMLGMFLGVAVGDIPLLMIQSECTDTIGRPIEGEEIWGRCTHSCSSFPLVCFCGSNLDSSAGCETIICILQTLHLCP